jgi:tetratricopeptide (TPR) repeat protein
VSWYKDYASRAKAGLKSWAEGEALQTYYSREVADGETLGDEGKGEGYRWAMQVAESEIGKDDEAYERIGMKLARRLYVSRKAEKWQEAESLLTRLISAYHSQPPVSLLVLIFIATSRYSEANMHLQSLPRYSQSSALHLSCALVALAQGKTEEFQQKFSEYVGKDEGEMASTWLLGLVYYVTTEVMGELNGEKEVPAMFEPVDWGIPAWGMSADCFPILPQLLELIQSHALPHVPDVYSGFGLMRASLDDLSGDFPERLDAAMQGIEENSPLQADMLTMKAYYYHIEKKWDLAERHYARALRIHQHLHPANLRTFLALKKLALLYLHCNRLSLALSTYQSALDLALSSSFSALQIYYARVRMGEVRVRMGQGERAEEEYRQALMVEGVGEEEKAEGWLGLAKALECRGQVTDAITAYLACISALESRIPPSILLYLAYFKLASFLITATERYAEATEYLEKAALVLGEAPAVEEARKRAETLEKTNKSY